MPLRLYVGGGQMIARIMKYVVGISVGLVLLAIVSFWVVLDGPKALWYKIFPIVEYDNLEVVLEVDGEIVTIRGTARCSITPSSGYSGGPNPARRARWGGDATVVLKDGRALVVPYTNRDWCYSGRGARGFMRKWWDTYKKADFDERVPLEGHFPLLILDNGDEPTAIDLLLGPGYYAQPDIEIKLISSTRWASKEGSETYPHLEWLRGGGGDKARRDRWVGGVVTELSLSNMENNVVYRRFMSDLRKGISGRPVSRHGGFLKLRIEVDSERISYGAILKNRTVKVNEVPPAFRVKLFNYEIFGDQMETVTGNLGNCDERGNGWDSVDSSAVVFLQNEQPKSLWNSKNLFWDAVSNRLLLGTHECVNTANITNRFKPIKK